MQKNDPKEEKKIFNLLEDFFQKYGVIHIQKNSYEHFINTYLQKIINDEPEITVTPKKGQKFVVQFGDIFVDKPHIIEEDRSVRYITPAESRIRDLTYDGPVCINIKTYFIENEKITEEKVYNKKPIARIPIMVGTSKCNLFKKTKNERIKMGECEYDDGGYFIIKGKERAIISQERINYNIIYVFPQKNTSKYYYVAEIRSISEETGHSVLVQSKIYKNDRTIVFSLPYIQQDIAVGIVFKALGFIDPDEIKEMIYVGKKCPRLEKLKEYIIRDSHFIQTQEEALNYIGNYSMHIINDDKNKVYSEQILSNELFPHLGIYSSNKERALFLGFMVSKLLSTYLKIRPEDDRDHISNKRIETTGILIGDIFRSLYKRLLKSLQPQLTKRQDIDIALSRLKSISHGLRHCFSTGNWGVQKNAYIRTGVSQILSRLTYNATKSHLRRIVIPIGKEGKNTQIRQLHPSQIGYICPSETPEGGTAGIVKNFALLTGVTTKTPTTLIKDILYSISEIILLNDIEKIDESNYKVLLNGIWIGITKTLEKTLEEIKEKRDKYFLNSQISISYDIVDKEILIFCDEGRMIRPLFNKNVEKKFECIYREMIENRWRKLLQLVKIRPLKKNNDFDKINQEQGLWDLLINENVIEYLDSYEVENMTVAMFRGEMRENKKFNYCEIHPSMILGVCASMIPFCDHTQSPRVCYYASMGKQAMGIYALSNNVRTDTVVNMLLYPQKSIISTKPSDFIGINTLPSGVNTVVAIACYTGFNQEDSIIMNKSSIDRGLFRSMMYRTVCIEEKKRGNNSFENIELPENDIRIKSYNYRKLDENGIIELESRVNKGDILVGKIVSNINKEGEIKNTDCSVVAKIGEEGIVEKIIETITPDGYKLIKIKIRSLRIPEVGDKFSSRSAQKGTIGMIYSSEDMPFTSEGIVPDIIMNPHALPSRMTINQLIETVGAKSSAIKGKFKDSTPFSNSSTNIIEKLCEELKNCGFKSDGYETMYSGFTGEEFPAQIFIGPTYYQRLKHLVKDKEHARNFGNVQSLCRQPSEGRSRDGGLRFGEMERDCMISHGVSKFLNERLFDMSDPFQTTICNSCGNIIVNLKECHVCKSDELYKINIPYACKLLFQELMAMGIKISLKTNQ